jgi:hypothetical protein
MDVAKPIERGAVAQTNAIDTQRQETPSNGQTVRVTVDVNARLNAMLERLAKENGTSKSEILRRAATLFEAAHEAGKSGDFVGITDDQSKLKTRFIGI